MLRNVRGSLAAALEKAEVTKAVTLHSLRHTYTAARTQTTDHGAPVSPYTVMRELGHASLGLIEKTYGHLTNVRHRSPIMEYRRTAVVDLDARRESA
jgi:integrase